jgi:hypothetical protein
MVLNANFLPCYNGYTIKKNRDCVEIMDEHAHTQVKMCGQLIIQLPFHEN